MLERVSVVLIIQEHSKSFTELDYLLLSGLKRADSDEIFSDRPPEKANFIGSIEVDLIIGMKRELSLAEWNWVEQYNPKLMPLDTSLSYAESYNSLFKLCDEEYVCVFRPFIYFDNDWLLQLMYFNKNIENSGIVSIFHDLKDCVYLPMQMASQDKRMGVFVSQNQTVTKNAIIFFRRELLYLVGALDDASSMGGYEWLQFEQRIAMHGMHNFYVCGQATISILKEDNYDGLERAMVASYVNKMAKNKSLYIPLFKIDGMNGTFCTP